MVTESNSRNPDRLNHAERNRHFLHFRPVLFVVIFAATLALSSCVDLSEITQFASSSKDVGNSFKQIAYDTLSSCKTANTFITAVKSTLNCDVYANLEPSLIKVNDAFFAYIASLGKLAGADTAKKDVLSKISDDLKQADSNISKENLDRASKAGGLADVITHVILSGYQQRELAKIIGEQNDSVQAVAKFLSDYAADKCEKALTEEKLLQGDFFEEKYGLNRDKEPLAAYLLRAREADSAASIDTKIQAVEKYKQAVATVASAHQKLFDQRNKWDTQQLVKDLGPDIQQLGDAATSMIKAFE